MTGRQNIGQNYKNEAEAEVQENSYYSTKNGNRKGLTRLQRDNIL
jgi:hypothetical protein